MDDARDCRDNRAVRSRRARGGRDGDARACEGVNELNLLWFFCLSIATRGWNRNQISMRLPVDWEESSASGGGGGWKKAHVEAKTPDSGSG